MPFWVFPCACWNPYFIVFCHLEWPQRRTIFQKQIAATKMSVCFFTIWTQIVFAYFFWKMTLKKKPFSSQPPKNTIFHFFLRIFFFHVFHIVLFTFSNIKKTKTKSAHFFLKTLFWHPDKLPKIYFRTPTHYLCFSRPAKNTIKQGKTNKKKSWTDFQRNLGRIFNSETPKSWTDFQLYSAYIYIWLFVDMHTHPNSNSLV